MQVIIGSEIFSITETENGYRIKSVNADRPTDVKKGELNGVIYRLMEQLGI